MKHSKLIAPLIVLTSLSCTTYTVQPESQNLTWSNGKGFTTVTSDNVKLGAALDYQGSDSLNFIVEVENLSEKDLTISPNSFYLSGSALDYETLGPIDPEYAINSINQDIDRNVETTKTSGWEVASSLVETTVALTGQEKETERQARLKRQSDREKEKEDAKNQITYLQAQKKELENTSLRRNTLSAKTKLKGALKFSSKVKDGTIAIVFVSSGKELRIPFKVVKN